MRQHLGMSGRGDSRRAGKGNAEKLKPTEDERVKTAGPLLEIGISLPDLQAATEFVAVADHCRMVGAFIVASELEQLKSFEVVDALVDMFQRGDLPLGKGAAGTRLHNYWREAPNRMSDAERQNFYAITLGLPTGEPGVASNRDFQHLWLRFVSAVSSFVRESRAGRPTCPAAIKQRHVKTAARELAVNMSAHGYGMVFYAAADLQTQLKDMIAILSDKQVRAAFGARDMWGVIDHIAQTELGGARNSSRHRMLATTGAVITNWIANHSNRLGTAVRPMIDLARVAHPPRRRSSPAPASNPTDYDLVDACELWLADSGLAAEARRSDR
jgi:hypothetical protein